jgi:D-glycero-D-manno-heptose 1,7-bisphosphate phosphatase
MASPQRKPAVFLDRDGTINEEAGYLNHPSRLKLVRGAAAAIQRLNEKGLLAVAVTNQSGVGRGYFTEGVLAATHERMRVLLARLGARLDAVYYCPHHPDDKCACRKPKPGMIRRAARDLPVDLEHSYMVGDRIKDCQFGAAMGLRTVLVLTGYGRGEHEYQRDRWTMEPDHVARNLPEAVEWILDDLRLRGALPSRQKGGQTR